ncbi:MAG: glycosyltransferase family 39 protein [Candidatus Limnocylindrales bacterium]
MSDRLTGLRRSLGYSRALALVTTAGALLRLAFLARQPIGYDEDFSAVVLHHPPDRMLDIVGRDSAPPLFYLLAWLPAQLGASPWALRLVPALAGIALIPLVAALARRVAGDASGLWAGVFVAILPTTVMLSEFARMSGLAGTLTAAATLLLWRATESPSPGRWAAYAAAAAAAVWTSYFAVLALVAIVLAGIWLAPSRRVAAGAGIATAVAVLTLAPWLFFARAQFEHAGGSFWVPPLSPTTIGGTLGQLFTGPPVDSELPLGPWLIALQCVAVAAGCVVLAAAAVAWRRLPPTSRRAALFCLLASGGVLVLAMASIWRPLLEARYAGVMWLPLFALAGLGLAALPRRVAVALVVALAVPTLALSVAVTHAETSSLVPELDARAGDHDLVAASPSHYLVLLDEAGPRTQGRLHVLAADDPPWFDGTAAYPPGAVIHAVPADVTANRGLIFWVADPGAAPPLLPAGYRSTESRCAIGVCLTVYGPAD